MTDQENFSLAESYYNGEEYDKAFLLYKELAQNGHVNCEVMLGWMYQNGLGTEKDPGKAHISYQSAANLGSPEAQFYLAKSYAKQKDFERAEHWYRKAAEKNYSPALYRIGWIYEVGRGVKRDSNKAFVFYERAADLGHIFARKQVARFLMRGHLGTLKRLQGLLLFASCVISIVKIVSKDPYSELLRE